MANNNFQTSPEGATWMASTACSEACLGYICMKSNSLLQEHSLPT